MICGKRDENRGVTEDTIQKWYSSHWSAGWEGSLEVSSLTSCLKWVSHDLVKPSLEILWEQRFDSLSCNVCPCCFLSLNLPAWVCGCCPCVVLSANTSENLAIIFVLDFTIVVAATRSTLSFQTNNFSFLGLSMMNLFCSSLTHLDSSFRDLCQLPSITSELGGAKANTIFQAWPHCCQAEGSTNSPNS